MSNCYVVFETRIGASSWTLAPILHWKYHAEMCLGVTFSMNFQSAHLFLFNYLLIFYLFIYSYLLFLLISFMNFIYLYIYFLFIYFILCFDLLIYIFLFVSFYCYN